MRTNVHALALRRPRVTLGSRCCRFLSLSCSLPTPAPHCSVQTVIRMMKRMRVDAAMR